MSEPITRPGELSRLAGGDEYRLFMLTTVMEIKAEASASKEWRHAHDADDERRFAAGESRMAAIESKVGGAISGVNGLKSDKEFIKGIWKGLTIVALVGASIIGSVAWLYEHIGQIFSKGQP